jgi:hypothetical protein
MTTLVDRAEWNHVLQSWRGTRAKIWQVHPSLGTRTLIQLYRASEPVVLYILGVSCERITGKFYWTNSCVELIEERRAPDESAWQIRDESSGFALHCSSVVVFFGEMGFELDGARLGPESPVTDLPRMGSDQARSSSIEQLAAFSSPMPLAVADDQGDREQRNWIIRTGADVSEEWDTGRASAEITEYANASLELARAERGMRPLDPEQLARVRLIRIDSRHLIVNVVTETFLDDTHAPLLLTVASLGALERRVSIDDIQGIPRRYWRVLIGPAIR